MPVRRDALEAPFYELDTDFAETSIEPFDRLEFTRQTVARMLPRMRVAVCPGARQVQVMSGKLWREPGDRRWVLIAVPASASRRAIVNALAAAGLGGEAPPFIYDALLGDR